MNYRMLGKTGEKVSILGFGCMRLPVIDGKMSKINEPETIKMIRYGIDHGVNYVDTAYMYHEGNSELVVGKALQNGYRQKTMLATKLPIWNVKKSQDMVRLLDEQLKKLQTDYLDFYLVHALNRTYWPKLVDLGLFEFLLKAQTEGKIKHIGFSYHDDSVFFPEIVDSFPWSFCQIQYNYLDETFQAGKKGLEYAHSKGLGVVIMEPLRGGVLANKLSPQALDIVTGLTEKVSPAEFALKWVWEHPQVSIALSGMTEMKHVVDNVAYASDPNLLSLEAKEAIKAVQAHYREKTKVNCTSCRYCVPCPSGVDIPQCFEFYNQAYMLENIPGARFWYNGIGKASKCTECGECETHCPQNIPIRENLKHVKELFETSNDVRFP